MSLNNLQPQQIWNNFEKLNAIPRASKKETQVVKFIENFGKTLGLETYVDKVGNVIIKKPATAGMENKQTIALQSHLDMVHQKNSDTDFDFDTEGIKMYIDGDWVKARGTTLGADNGIGVATIMSILESKDIPHPPLEALFTIDEETGMTGALSLQPGLLKASIMLNLDTEEDNELTIGCAGGIDVTAQGTYKNEKPQANNVCFELVVKGLTGGHSGTDIHLGRGNANKIMNRILGYIANQIPIQISTINGGGLRNAIPRESKTKVCCQTNDKAKFEQLFNEIAAIVKVENAVTDPDMAVQIIACDVAEGAMSITDSVNFIRAVSACPN